MKTKKSKSELDLEELSDIKLTATQPLMRTSLRFSKKGHEAIKEIGDLMGVKNAEVFKKVLEVSQNLKNSKSGISGLSDLFDKEPETIRKTYIIGKKTLSKISQLANELKVPRDRLIDQIVQLLSALAGTKASEKKDNYRNANEKIINPFWSRAEEIEKELKDKLGEDDPVVHRFGLIIVHVMNLSQDIDDYLSSGTPIEEFK